MRRHGRGRARLAARDRWMVSYADMVTLLFACFAALYASSVVPATAATTATAAAATAAASESAAHANAALAEAIESAVARVDPGADVVVQVATRGVVVSLPEASAFAVGQADLSQAARQVIRELATVLEQETGDIRVEGHSDDVPITTSRFASNWDLSAARATEVIRFLLAQTAIAPSRLSAAGYGEFRPLVANDSAESRAKNRRVDIVVYR
jgi:chemotaxis protein MotB